MADDRRFPAGISGAARKTASRAPARKTVGGKTVKASGAARKTTKTAGRLPAAKVTAPGRRRDEPTQRETVRLTADLPAGDAATLREVAQATGFNKVTTLVRAIRVLAELVNAERDGGELTIKYADGRRERLLLR